MHRRAILAITGVAGLVLAAGVAVSAGWLGGPTRHDAGAGPLSTGSGRADQTLALDPVNAGTIYSVATRLCVRTGGPVVLTSVTPLDTLGTDSDWTYLGARLRRVPAGDTNGFLGVEGFPPPGAAGELVPIDGAVVDTPCDAEEFAERTEIISGFSTPAGSSGGGWTSMAIGYSQGGQQYSLVVHDTWVLCGPATAQVPECEDYLAGTTTP